jgi:hypothetical protein
VNALPIDPVGPLPRDLPNLLGTSRAEHFFHGNWGWFAMLVAVALLAPVVEELLFRGLLLPRCAPPSESATSSPTAPSSGSTTCTSREASRPA